MPADPAKFDAAMRAFRKRVPMTKGEWLDLDRAQREYAFTVAGVSQANMVAQVWDAVDSAIEHGEDLEDFKGRVGELLESEWGRPNAPRVETIFRTNINTAYNAGRHAVFTAPAVKEARPYFRFDTIDDDRRDDECEALDGTILPQDDPFWDANIPPLHFNCRCSFVALTAEEAGEEGVAPEAPDDQAEEGFGDRPSDVGDDWAPDVRDYPAAVGDVLGDVLR